MSGAQVTDFFFSPYFERLFVCEAVNTGGGVDVAGDSLRVFIVLSTSWKGSTDDGCATFSSFFTGTRTGAFLKLGNFGLGFGVEKNDESDFASLTAVTETIGFALSFMSLMTTAFTVIAEFERACFFWGGCGFVESSPGFRFFSFESIKYKDTKLEHIR